MNDGARHAWVLESERDGVARALLHREGCQQLDAGGRGGLYRFPLSKGCGALRVFRRGGLPGKVLADGYLLANRPRAEFCVHLQLYERGVAMPEPLGVLWEQTGPRFRGAIATRYIEGDSLHALLASGRSEVLTQALAAAGKAIRGLHDAGGLHADLHPGNLMVAQGTAFLIDFDRARALGTLRPGQRAANLLRLRRAFVKHGFNLAHFDALMDAYGDWQQPSSWRRGVALLRESWVRARQRKGGRGDSGA